MTAGPPERSLELGAVARTDFVKFAGAGGDFNPMHHDDEVARAAGFPSVFAMGMLTASMAARIVTDWFPIEDIRTYHVRFRAMVWPGEVLTARARLGDAISTELETRRQVEFDVTNSEGEVKISGTAEVVDQTSESRR